MSTETQTPRRPAGRGFGPGRGLGRGAMFQLKISSEKKGMALRSL